MSRLLLLCAATAALLVPSALAQPLAPVWESINLGRAPGVHGLWTGDLDGDGSAEIVATGGEGSFVAILEWNGTEYAPTWASPPLTPRFSSIQSVLVADIASTGAASIYVFVPGGTVYEFNGATRTLARTHSLGTSGVLLAAKFADLDGDGVLDLVTSTGGEGVRQYDARTFAQTWQSTVYGEPTSLAVGDVTNNGTPDLVLSTGYVLDGPTKVQRWRYVGGFGFNVDVGRVGTQAYPLIVGASENTLTVFDASVRSPVREVVLPSFQSFLAFVLSDVNGDGVEDALVTSPYGYGLAAYDLVTSEQLWEVYINEGAPARLAVGDPDGDGDRDVIVSSSFWSSTSQLTVLSLATREVEARVTSDRGSYSGVFADVDARGVRDLVLSPQERGTNGGAQSAFYVFDGLTRERRRTLPLPGFRNVERLFDRVDPDGSGRERVLTARASFPGSIEVIDGLTAAVYARLSTPSSFTAATAADLDGDGADEVVTGTQDGRVQLWSGPTLARAWQSTVTGTSVGGVVLAQCDADDALEIVLFNLDEGVQIYDSATRLLEWQSKTLTGTTALAVADLDGDGVASILTGHADGTVRETPCDTRQPGAPVQVATGSIRDLRAFGLDASPALEVLALSRDESGSGVGGVLHVLAAADLSEIWRSDALTLAQTPQMVVGDLGGDGFANVLVPSTRGAVLFASPEPYPDVIPPRVLAVAPAEGRTTVSRDAEITVEFSEPVDPASLTGNVGLFVDDQPLPVGVSVFDDGLRITMTAPGLLPASAAVEVRLSGAVTDVAGNGLDGNGNGVSDGAGVDDVAWTFTTGSGIDDVPPTVSALVLSPATVWTGDALTVRATASDSSAVATGSVVAAEVFVGVLGAPGSGQPLAAVDGAFDSPEELVEAFVPTTGLEAGTLAVWVRAQDDRGQWGEPARGEVTLIGSAGAAWASINGNPQNTGVLPGATLAPPFESLWTGPVTGLVAGLATTPDALVATFELSPTPAPPAGQVAAFDLESGVERWRSALGPYMVASAPTIAYGTVFVHFNMASGSGSYLAAYDLATGAQRWRQAVGLAVFQIGGPVVAEGLVFVPRVTSFFNGNQVNEVVAYDATTGETRWTLPLSTGGTRMAYADGFVYVLLRDRYLRLRATTGETTSEPLPLPHESGSYTAVVTGGTLLRSNPVSAVRLSDASEIWTTSEVTFGQGVVPPAVDDELVYAFRFGLLKVYDRLTGAQRWTRAVSGSVPMLGPVVAGGTVYITTTEALTAVDLATQQTTWSLPGVRALALTSDRLFVGTNRGVRAFRPIIVSDDGDAPTPLAFALRPVAPNPVRETATVAFDLPAAARVTAEAYDALGRRVMTVLDEDRAAGPHRVVWNTSSLPAGAYLIRLRAGSETATVRAVVVR